MPALTYTPRFEYRCENGHAIAATRPIEHCPAAVRGVPCAGTLTRVGRGSRSEKADA